LQLKSFPKNHQHRTTYWLVVLHHLHFDSQCQSGNPLTKTKNHISTPFMWNEKSLLYELNSEFTNRITTLTNGLPNVISFSRCCIT
jgi:hypothetical protein